MSRSKKQSRQSQTVRSHQFIKLRIDCVLLLDGSYSGLPTCWSHPSICDFTAAGLKAAKLTKGVVGILPHSKFQVSLYTPKRKYNLRDKSKTND